MGFFVRVEEGVRLYVEDLNPAGAKPVLFLHGWPLSHRQFEYQFNVLPAWGFRCIGVDWRGFGQADKPYQGYSFDRLSDDLRVVVDALGLQNFTLAGHSTGGSIAIRYMTRHRGHGVSRLVLIAAAAPVGLPAATADRLLMETLSDRPKMMRGVTESFFFQFATPEFADWFSRIGLHAAGWSTAAVLRTLRNERLDADLPQISVPTLIMHGVHDRVVPFAQALVQHRNIRNSRLVPFMYSGHGLFWEERDRFNAELAQFAGG
jgi:non-heme chloroperoxidase